MTRRYICSRRKPHGARKSPTPYYGYDIRKHIPQLIALRYGKRTPRPEELMDYFGMSRATAYRHRARYIRGMTALIQSAQSSCIATSVVG